MRCPLCLGRFFLRSLPCGHFLCSYCLLSVRFRQYFPSDAVGCPQCIGFHQKSDFRHRTPTMAFTQNGKNGINGQMSTLSPTVPPLYSPAFIRPAGGSIRRNSAGGEEQQQRTTALGMRTLRRSRIFPTMEKRANGSEAFKYLCPELAAERTSAEHSSTTTTPTTAPQRLNCTGRRRVGQITAPAQSVPPQNSWASDNCNSRTFFAALVRRFDAALNLQNAADGQTSANGGHLCADRKNAHLLLSAKEHLCKSEQRIWNERIPPTTDAHPLAADRCHHRPFYQLLGHNDRSMDRQFGVVRKLRELVVAMEECNRQKSDNEQNGQSANVWRTKVGQARIQVLALSVLLLDNFGDGDRNSALLKRHISLLGIRMNGRANERNAEEVLDVLLMCSTQINSILERRVFSFPAHLISAIAHVQFCLFDTMEEITHQLFDLQTEKRIRVWQIINRCFGQLLQMESLSWKSNEFPWKRFTLTAYLAKFLHQFADVCDTPTQMLCIIEVEKARAFVAEEIAMNCELREKVHEQLTRIELKLAECQRVQKWNELKLDTQIVRRKDWREMGAEQNDRRRRNAKMRGWIRRMLSEGRKLTKKMMGRRNG